MPNQPPPKPFSLVHLQMIDVNTGEKIEFRFLPADIQMLNSEPQDTASRVRAWPNDAASYNERCRQIEGPTISLKITAETQPPLTEVILTPGEANAQADL